MIHGPDVSSYQQSIDWAEVRTISELAIVKVTEGNGFTNPRAVEQVMGAAQAGLIVMLYHYAQPNGPNWIEDADAESERLDKVADAFEQKIGAAVFTFVDVERNTPLTVQEKPLWRDWAKEFRRHCRKELSRIIGWYSGKEFTRELGLDPSWQDTVLWGAAYPATFRADCNYGYWLKTVPPWFRADLWQHGGGDSNGSTCPGIKGPCDFNTFAGTRAELEQLIGGAA